MCRPTIDLPSAYQLQSDLQPTVNRIMASITKELLDADKVNLALDGWTSPNKIAFLAIKAHWISKVWQLKEALIGFEEVTGKHDGENFAKIVTACLEQYDITKKILSVTTDNAGNNLTMTRSLEATVSEFADEAGDIHNTHIYRIPCLAHVIQLAVKALTDSISATATNEDEVKNISSAEIEEVRKERKGFARTLNLVSILTQI